ncbi:hypothetical protein CLU79DRAFT_724852 [Phycomyces nitens]|nr:hypothetical protein CLU79DRAFT_724852 [Phycomyces nitens]
MSNAITNTSNTQRPLLQRNVPAFLNKLYNMVNDPGSDELIRWADDGQSFIVIRHEDFAKRVLPRFFKHSNFSSFVRQLNMYGFHKVPHLQQGVLQADSESERWEFSNPHFQRNQPDLLLLVTRKKGRDPEDKETSAIDLHHIMDEISAIKKHQMDISTQLNSIQRDNQFLWQETISARERHQRHQETIDKILRFLASVFSSEKKSVSIPRKRRYLLGDIDTNYSKGGFENGGEDEDEEEEEEIERKRKVTRLGSPKFDLGDYVDSHTDLSIHDNSLATLPATLSQSSEPFNSNSPSNPSSELADAIALNDKSKQDVSTPPPPPPQPPQDQTSLVTTQQLQGLQSLSTLIALAQSNPAFLSQLTGEVPFTSPEYMPFIENSLPFNNYSTNDSPTTITTTKSPDTFSTPSPTPGSNMTPNQMSPVNGNIANLTKAADAISQGIDALGTNIESLAQHLGFDPTHYPGDELDYVNLDDLIDTYVPASIQTDNIHTLHGQNGLEPENRDYSKGILPSGVNGNTG